MIKTDAHITYATTGYDIDHIFLREFGVPPRYSFVQDYNKDVLEEIIKGGYELCARHKYVKDHDYLSPFQAAINDKTDDSDYAVYINRKDHSVVSVTKESKFIKLSFYEPDEKALIKRQKSLSKFVHKETHNKQMGLLTHKSHGTRVEWYDLAEMTLDLALNYGSDFATKTHVEIVKKLNERPYGLYLFHGTPGTGKTTYIKYLATTLDKKFIFIPQSHAAGLDGPSLISLLTSNPNAILVLEDAETLIYDREIADNHVISTILNLSDGIVGSLLKTSIILTYNTAHNKIDKALTRKGRLCVEHEFGKLSIKDSQALAAYLGVKEEIKESMTIGDIYNMSDVTFHEEKTDKKPIGFGKT